MPPTAFWGSFRTTKAFTLMSSSESAWPTTAASRTASWRPRADSTSKGETHIPDTLIMSSARPEYVK